MRRIGLMAATMLAGVCLMVALLSMPAAASVSQATPTATPTLSAAARTLAFVANGRPSEMYTDEYGIYQLYVVDPDGGRLSGLDKPLTPRDGDADAPSWSPDGMRIVYSFSPLGTEVSYIEVINADGSGRQRLTHGGVEHSPAWSPDGQTIAYINDTDGAIYAMHYDGSSVRLLVDTHGAPELDWSPDGAYLLVGAVDARDNGRLYVMAVDGAAPGALPTEALSVFGGVWSPDGSRIAYISGSNILISADRGKTVRRLELTGPLAFALNETAYPGFAWLDWSPSGHELAAAAFSGALQVAVSTPVPFERVGWQIVIIDVETGEAHLVTYGFDNRAPDWRPVPGGAPQ